MKFRLASIIIVVLALCWSCKNDKIKVEDSILNIRIPKDPEKLNPVFNPSPTAREIFQYIFVPLADYHPESLELHPILIKTLPSIKMDREGLIGFEMEFKEEANWADGKPVTAEDYKFTIKAVKHPETNARVWRAYVNFIKEVIVDPANPKKFTVYVDNSYMLAKEVATTIYILPKHIYDENSILDKIELSDLLTAKSANEKIQSDSLFSQFAQSFNDPINYRDKLVSAGPYQLTEKESGQYYILNKKENYWGERFPENPFLKSNIDKLVFKIIPDEVAALTALKSRTIDLMKIKSSSEFKALKEEASNEFQYFSPQLMRMQYIAINNDNEKLRDKEVRKALAHLIDVDDIIETIDFGYGIRSTGPFHPSKSYYNKSIEPIDYDVTEATNLLKSAGWVDSDNDGDVDKIINGKSVDLELEFLISGSPLAKKVALLFQESAKKAGVKINIVSKSFQLIRKENLYPHNFDLVASLRSSDAAPDDPYAYWHSESADPGKQNVFSYKSEKSDSLIEAIRTTRDIRERNDLYLKFQEQIHEDQPVIFLYAPLDKILISNKVNATVTSKRPGYLANTFSLN